MNFVNLWVLADSARSSGVGDDGASGLWGVAVDAWSRREDDGDPLDGFGDAVVVEEVIGAKGELALGAGGTGRCGLGAGVEGAAHDRSVARRPGRRFYLERNHIYSRNSEIGLHKSVDTNRAVGVFSR